MRAIVLPLLTSLAATAQAATYTVGPSGQHGTLNALFASIDLQPGDVVEVQGGVTYAGGVIVPASDGGAPGNPVILRSVGAQRARLDGGVNTIEFRLSDHMVFEGFEVTGAANTFRCVYHHAHDIVLRDVLIHDCPQHGVLGADEDSGSLTIEYSEIHTAGQGTQHHLVYMSTDQAAHPGSVFRLQHSYLHNGTGGNLIKSRAERNEIYYNWLEGGLYHELELIGPDPGGTDIGEANAREDSDIVGNVIAHTASFGAIMRFGGDGTGQTYGRYRVVNNTIVRLGAGDTTVFRLFDGIDALDAHNNVIWRDGDGAVRIIREVEADWAAGVTKIDGSNNWIDTNATFVPAGWSGTLTGANPGFANGAGFDFRLLANSGLLNAANASPVAAPDYAIANPLALPVRHPPLRAKPAPGVAELRPLAAPLDIGAFERADPATIHRDGFE